MKGNRYIMNILFVTGAFAGNEKDTTLSGMPNAVYKSAIGMQRRGHRVRILTVAKADRRWRYRGLQVISIRAQNGIKDESTLNSLFCVLNREYKIEKTIQQLHREKPIDIIQYTGWSGIGLFHFTNIPAVMRVSSYTKAQLEHYYFGSKKFLFSTVEYFAAKRMNYIFAPSRIMAENMAKDLARKVGIIETPYLWEKMSSDDSIMQTKLAKRKYILFFGRMSEDKGILTIKDILYRVLARYSDIYFVFVGYSWKHNGIDIEQELISASQKYKDRVIFLGLLPKESLMPVISHAEMVLMPSLVDNFPNSCAEAMSLGKIVIGTDGSSLEQFIENGKNGYLIPIGDADSLYRRVEYVLNMDDEQKSIISANAQKRIKKLDIDHYSKKMEKLYKAVIGKVVR